MKGEKKYEAKHLKKNDTQPSPPEWIINLITDFLAAAGSGVVVAIVEHLLSQPK